MNDKSVEESQVQDVARKNQLSVDSMLVLLVYEIFSDIAWGIIIFGNFFQGRDWELNLIKNKDVVTE